MTQTHKIRPSADRLVAWSDEEEAQMRAVAAACDGFIESRFPGEQPCYEQTAAQPMRYTRRNRWYDYTDTAPAQQDEPTPDKPCGKKKQTRPKKKQTRGILAAHDAELREMCADHTMSCAKIGKHFDVDASTVAKYTREHGIKRAWCKHARGAIRLTLDAHREDITQWLHEGRQQKWIAAQLGVSAKDLSIYIRDNLNK